MFTGIIEEIGKIKEVQWGSHSARLQIEASRVLEDVKVGDSIAVNGICLTVTEHTMQNFYVDVMPETMQRTNLGTLQTSSPVNLERALRLSDRLGGHLVSGHIDGTGRISQMRTDENAVWITISAQAALLKYIVLKGSVAIDGISLTVAGISLSDFQVSVIPHTGQITTLLQRQLGDVLNIECDITAKYIEKLLKPGNDESDMTDKTGLSMDYLKENGF